MTQDPNDLQDSGPIDYLVVEFPSGAMTGEAFPLLVDLVDRGIVRVLDLLVLRKEEDGTVSGVALDDLADGSTGLEVFAGVESGLLGPTTWPRLPRRSSPGRRPRCSSTRTSGPQVSRRPSAEAGPSSSRAVAYRSRRSSPRSTPPRPHPDPDR
ncbi:DUF6325 family protein [Oerskovia sp. M15]